MNPRVHQNQLAKLSLALIFIGIGGLILLVAGTEAAIPYWGSEQSLGIASETMSSLDISDSNVVAVWRQWDVNRYQVYGSCSLNGGTTWSTAQPISSVGGRASYTASLPKVAISGATAVAIWKEEWPFDPIYRVYSSRSEDAGATWGVAQRIDSGSSGGDIGNVDVAIDDSTVIAVWTQINGLTYQVYANRSANGGATWNEISRVDNNDGKSAYDPQVVVSDSVVVTVWSQSDGSNTRIYSNRSSNGGVTWVWNWTQLIEDNNAGNAWEPQVVISDSTVVAAWSQHDGSSERVYSNRSTNGGATWGADQLIEDNAGKLVNWLGRPHLAISESTVVAVWSQYDGSSYRIYSNRSTDRGVSWGSDQLLEDNTGVSAYRPRIAISGSNVVAVWKQNEIRSNRSANSGATWGADQLISGDGNYPQIAMSTESMVIATYGRSTTSTAIYANRLVFSISTETQLPVSTAISTDSQLTTRIPVSTSESFVQVNFEGGTRTSDGTLWASSNTTGAGANYTTTTALLNRYDTVVIPIWTNQTSMRLYAGLRSDTSSLFLNGGIPDSITNNDTGRRAFGSTTIMLEFANSAGRLLGNAASTVSIGDSFAYTIRYFLSETTTALYRSLGFDTVPGSTSFRFYYADTYGGQWRIDTGTSGWPVTVTVTAGNDPGSIIVIVSGITKDLPGGLGGAPPAASPPSSSSSSSAPSSSGGACLIQRSGAPTWIQTMLRATRDHILQGTFGRMLVALYYAVSNAG